MRIAYLARWDISHESGILKKMVAQMRTWMELGHEVRFFAFSPGEETWSGLDSLDVAPVHRDGLITRLLGRRSLSRPILDWRPDVVYLRWSTWYPAWEAVADHVSTVVEINGDDVRDNRLSLPYPLYLFHRITRNRLLSRADGFVSVSREFTRRTLYTRYRKPMVVIGNGTDMSRIPILPAPDNTNPRLVFVGYADCAWHGLDKLSVLAAACPEWHIDVIGTGAPAGAPELPANLHFHGHLPHSEYLEFLRYADVAVGTLALHRKHLDSTSAIKTSEYMAHGIPTIIAYEDTDFTAGHPLLLQIPNTPTNIQDSLGAIRAFVERARGQRVERSSIAHLDVRVKERQRLAFLSQVAAGEV